MNLTDSMKHVLSTKGTSIFNEFLKEDLLGLVQDFSTPLIESLSGKSFLKKRRSSKHLNFLALFRVRKAFSELRDDYLHEVDQLIDSKEKTKFSLKVLSSLSAHLVRTLARLGPRAYSRKTFLQLFILEVTLKVSRLFLLRFLQEVEKNLTEESDLKKVQVFKGLLLGEGEANINETEEENDFDHRAVEIVENFRNYLVTGKRNYYGRP